MTGGLGGATGGSGVGVDGSGYGGGALYVGWGTGSSASVTGVTRRETPTTEASSEPHSGQDSRPYGTGTAHSGQTTILVATGHTSVTGRTGPKVDRVAEVLWDGQPPGRACSGPPKVPTARSAAARPPLARTGTSRTASAVQTAVVVDERGGYSGVVTLDALGAAFRAEPQPEAAVA